MLCFHICSALCGTCIALHVMSRSQQPREQAEAINVGVCLKCRFRTLHPLNKHLHTTLVIYDAKRMLLNISLLEAYTEMSTACTPAAPAWVACLNCS